MQVVAGRRGGTSSRSPRSCRHAAQRRCLHATCLRAYVPTCLRAYVPTCLRAYVPTCLRAYVRACVRAGVLACASSSVVHHPLGLSTDGGFLLMWTKMFHVPLWRARPEPRRARGSASPKTSLNALSHASRNGWLGRRLLPSVSAFSRSSSSGQSSHATFSRSAMSRKTSARV